MSYSCVFEIIILVNSYAALSQVNRYALNINELYL